MAFQRGFNSGLGDAGEGLSNESGKIVSHCGRNARFYWEFTEVEMKLKESEIRGLAETEC